MASQSFLDALGDAVSNHSGRSSHRRHKKRRSDSRSRSRSPSPSSRSRRRSNRSFAGSVFGGDNNSNSGSYHKHNSSRGSFFGLGNNFSRSSLFGSRPSYYKRQPRQGFLQRCLKELKRLLRDLSHYARRNPWKVFFLVIMPLVTGGALTALLARFGLRIPPSIERMLGVASRAAASGDPFSAVGDAVRMAGEYTSSSSSSSPQYGRGGAPVKRGGAGRYGGAGGQQWDRRPAYAYSYDDRDDGEGWSENIRRSVSRIFT